jgi:hypothetical protein
MDAHESFQAGQRVRVREDVEKYGGLFGEIIHRTAVTEDVTYEPRRPRSGRPAARLALVVSLEDPAPGLEPVILCYEEQVAAAPPAG